MDSRRDFTSKKVFPGHFSELGEKANSALFGVIGVGFRVGLRAWDFPTERVLPRNSFYY